MLFYEIGIMLYTVFFNLAFCHNKHKADFFVSNIDWITVVYVMAVWLCYFIGILFPSKLHKGKEHAFEGPICFKTCYCHLKYLIKSISNYILPNLLRSPSSYYSVSS